MFVWLTVNWITEVLISKARIHLHISHGEFVSVNNELREHDNMKEEIKKYRLHQYIKDFSLFIKQCYLILWSAEKIQEVKTQSLKRQIGKLILLSKWAVCHIKKLRFIKEHQASGLLRNFGLKIHLRKILLLGNIFF